MSDEAPESIPQKELHEELDYPPSLDEVVKAIKQTSGGNSPDVDGITAEIFKHGGFHLTKIFR